MKQVPVVHMRLYNSPGNCGVWKYTKIFNICGIQPLRQVHPLHVSVTDEYIKPYNKTIMNT